jgi:transcriptional regulator with XRE-family HTH domain
MPTKKELQNKKELARYYYMEGETQKIIAVKLGVSEVTLSRWVSADNWQTKRAAKMLTRPQIINNLLAKFNDYLEDKEADDVNYDKLCKLAATIEKLDKKTNIVDTIEVFMAFNKWITSRLAFDIQVTSDLISAIKSSIEQNANTADAVRNELIKTINKLQDLYITENITK